MKLVSGFGKLYVIGPHVVITSAPEARVGKTNGSVRDL